MPVNDFAFVLQASAGDRSSAAAGTDELFLYDFSGALNGSSPSGSGGDFAWANGVANSFSVTYNGATRALSYTIAGVTRSVTVGTAMLITDIFLKTLATSAGSSMKIDNIVVDETPGVAGGDTALTGAQSFAQQTVGTEQLYYLWISGFNTAGSTSDSFSITGNLTMSWPGAGTAPTNTSTLAYMKFGAATGAPPPPVPEPASFALVGAGLAALGLAGRRRKQLR